MLTGPDNMQPEQQSKTGRYVALPRGGMGFIPNSLPPDPPVGVDHEMWTLLSEADRAIGRLDGVTEILPNPDLFVAMHVRREAVLSSQIEGTQASLTDLQAIVLGLRGFEIEKRAGEILKHLGRLQQEYRKFYDEFDVLGTHLKNARNKYEEASKRLSKFEGKLSMSAEFESLDSEAKELPGRKE